jgi:hypothetical protein
VCICVLCVVFFHFFLEVNKTNECVFMCSGVPVCRVVCL